ncbi:zinc finger, zz type domain-containing protein [Cryptosporidium felis]|nr:zinc finger, zz type domain-containing protein [Cryptosporidium felis]
MKNLRGPDEESKESRKRDEVQLTGKDLVRKFDEEKRKEALLKAKKVVEDLDAQGTETPSGSDSSSEEEDSDAELLDFKTQSKILETLNKIKQRDPSIYDRSHVIFPETDSDASSDSGLENSKVTGKKPKPLTFKDYERKMLLESQEDSEQESQKGRSRKIGYDKEQDELKRAFLEAAESLEDTGDETETLVKKEKTEEELENEKKSFMSFLSSGGAGAEEDPMESLNRYWGPEEDLDENERFLRNYILNQEWKESNGHSRINDESKLYTIEKDVEEEDERHLEISNEFESAYNFRYEEPGAGQQILGYSRGISSLRRPDDRRKQKRREKRERKRQERLRLQEELKLQKSIKRKEIIEKLKKIQDVSGSKQILDDSFDFDSEFDAEKHDKSMEELFGAEYNDEEERLSLSEILSGDGGLEADTGKVGKVGKSERKRKESKKDQLESEKEKGDEEATEESFIYPDDDSEWWQCDGCQKEILPTKRKFDCTVCENFTLCKSCCRNKEHEHPLEKSRVPPRMEQSEKNSSKLDMRLLKYGENEDINALLDEYYGLHFEDVLDNGNMPVRFKYTKVEKEDYGLSIEDILSMDDKELNQHISLKKLAPYRTDGNKRKKYLPPSKSSNKMYKKASDYRQSRTEEGPRLSSHINEHRLKSYY